MPIIAPVTDGKLDAGNTTAKKDNGITPTGSNLGYDQFLQLLCAEMQYQDPLEPTSNTDYVAQLATFSQLEATLSMENSQQSSMASGLVGKQVILKMTSETTGQTTYVDGRVDYVLYQGDDILLSVNDQLYPLSSLDTIADSEYYDAVTISKSISDMVAQLPGEDVITTSSKSLVQQVRDIYNSMTDYQKQFVPTKDLETLSKLEKRIAELEKAEAGSGEDGEQIEDGEQAEDIEQAEE